MSDYKMLYYKLFCAVADEIENLKRIQSELEDMVINSDDEECESEE